MVVAAAGLEPTWASRPRAPGARFCLLYQALPGRIWLSSWGSNLDFRNQNPASLQFGRAGSFGYTWRELEKARVSRPFADLRLISLRWGSSFDDCDPANPLVLEHPRDLCHGCVPRNVALREVYDEVGFGAVPIWLVIKPGLRRDEEGGRVPER